MQGPINQLILFVTTVVVCCSCSANESRKAPVTTETYSKSEKTTDARSPVGYWTNEVSYPVFSGKAGTAEIANRLNQKLESMRTQYRCSDGGDESFEADIHTLEENVVSIRYTAMWSCAAMPSPDSEEGAITAALPSLDEIDLRSQISDDGRYQTFLEKVESLYASKMAEKGRLEDCPFTDWEYYTLKPDAISLHFETSSHYPSDCAIEIPFPRKELSDLIDSDSPLLL